MGSSAPAAVSFFETNADEILFSTVIRTGIAALDDLLGGGFRHGSLTVLAAGTAAGKTSLACQAACGAAAFATEKGLGPVLFVSYETPILNLARKMMAQTADLSDGFNPLHGVSERDKPVARKALAKLAGLSLWIEDRCEASVDGVSKAMGWMGAAKMPSLVVIDYLGLMGKDGEDDKAALGDRVVELKRLAMSSGVAVLLVAQLSRNAERPDVLPTLRDVLVSAVPQYADMVLLLHRPSAFRPRLQIERSDYVEDNSTLIVAKNHFGPTCQAEMRWDERQTRFDFGARDAAQEV